MGLDDLVPDDKQSSSSSSGSRSRSSSSSDKVEIGSEPYKKTFDAERWKKIKQVLSQEMGLVPREVVNNWAPEERYETIHEAALVVEKEKEPEELSGLPSKCDICGNALNDETAVVIAGLEVCSNHPAVMVAKELNDN